MKKIIVSGATSMIGTALIKAAEQKGTEIYAIIRPDTDRKKRLVKSSLVHPVYGTMEELRAIDNMPVDCDVFYHFAWGGTSKTDRDDPLIHERNIKYTLDAVELAERCGCRRFVGAGSQAEYGPVEGVINEETEFAPIISYGIAKYAAGILSRKLCEQKGLEHVWGRIFSVYGPHDNAGTMLDYAIRCWEKGETAKFSSGTQFWNYLFEDDAGQLFFDMGKDSIPSGTYFVAHSESKPLRDYIEIMMKVYGSAAKAEFSEPTSSNIPGLKVDMKKTINVLRYGRMVDFEEGIKKMIKHYTMNG